MKRKSIAGAFIGHALEHYDITLYGFFATFLGTLFFPSDNPSWATLSSLVIFAAGFIMRPFGGIVFGYIGDQWGRKTALLWAILLVTIPTLIIGLLPSYQEAGIFSAVLLLLSRLLQGLCVGGEYSGAIVFIAEHTSKKRQGFFGGILCATGFLGAVLGTLVGSLSLSKYAPEWGWRIPFIIGGLFGILGYILRRAVEETPVFQNLNTSRERHFPLKYALKLHWKNIFCTIAIGANGLIPLYIATIYMNVLLTTKLHFSTAWILYVNMSIMILWTLLLPIAGLISDKIGQIKLMSWSAFMTSLLAFPLFLYLNADFSLTRVLVFQIIFSLAGIFYVGPLPALLPKLFPARLRYSSVAFSYTLGQALFAGTAPLIAKVLVDWTQNESAPAFYLCFSGFLGWIGIRYAKLFSDTFIQEKKR